MFARNDAAPTTRPALRQSGRGRRAPGRVEVLVRPFCYLLAALVWATIALIVTLAPAAMVVLVLTDQSLVHGIGERFSTVGGAIAMVAVVVPIMALVMGPVIVQLCLAAWPLAALSAIYVARALHPRYARQRLSFTRYATPGHTLGPPTLTGVALSLQPVHATKTTDTLMRMYEVGWSVDWRLLGTCQVK